MTVWEARMAIESSITVQQVMGAVAGLLVLLLVLAFYKGK